MRSNSIPQNLIEKLREKKHRVEKKLFLVEGATSLLELIGSDYEIDTLVISEEFYKNYRSKIENNDINYVIAHEGEIRKLSSLENNTEGIAVVKQMVFTLPAKKQGMYIALDSVRDPGNLGTIIRIADWYGIDTIVASEDTTDFYTPKTISATMGSFTRVKVVYMNLFTFLENCNLPVLGAYLDGTSVHGFHFPKEGVLIIGNESNGISSRIKHFIKHKVTIPKFGDAESLNAGISTAVILDNWKRSISG